MRKDRGMSGPGEDVPVGAQWQSHWSLKLKHSHIPTVGVQGGYQVKVRKAVVEN